MTLSHAEQSRRKIVRATEEVYADPLLWLYEDHVPVEERMRPLTHDVIWEAVEEHLGWTFDRRERDVVLLAWAKAAEKAAA